MGSIAPDETTDTNHPQSLDLGAGRTPANNLFLRERLHANDLGVVHQHHHLGDTWPP